MRARLLLPGLLLILSIVGSCAPGPDRPSGPGQLEVLDGSVEVSEAGGPFRAVSDPVSVGAGDVVRSADDGHARLVFGDASAELAPNTEVAVADGRLHLRRGSLLGDGRMRIDTEETAVTTSGTVRLDRGLAVRVGAYEGSAQIERGGDTVRLDRFREGEAARGFFPRATRPLRVDDDDIWDRRFLGDHLELQRGLEGFGLGLSVQSEAVPYVIGALGTQAAVSPIEARDPLSSAESVLAAGIAASSPGVYLQRLREAESLRMQGAAWAVIAATLRADTEAVLSRLTLAVDRGIQASRPPGDDTGPAGPGPRPRPGDAAPGPGAPGPGQPGPGGPAPGGPGPGPDPTPPPQHTPPPGPTPTPDPCPGCGPAARLICEATGVCAQVPLL